MTSWLHALAAAHPGVTASEPKELDFFSYHFDRGYRWYERHFAGPPGTPTVGFECSPSYFLDPRAPERAAAYHPGLKIVVLLRDPVARAYSNHLHEIAKGHIAPVRLRRGAGEQSRLHRAGPLRHASRPLARPLPARPRALPDHRGDRP